jgi:hypothetical protein
MEISEKVHLVGFSALVNNYRTMHGMYNIKKKGRWGCVSE